MKILCTDLEGTLAPEIWQEIANEYQIEDLQLTTREIPDFEELMQRRLDVLSKNISAENPLRNLPFARPPRKKVSSILMFSFLSVLITRL